MELVFNFSLALDMLRNGHCVARKGWTGGEMFIFMVPGSTFKVNRAPLLGIYPEGTEIQYHPHIDIKMARGPVMPWTPSHADLLSDDWCDMGTAIVALHEQPKPSHTNVGPVESAGNISSGECVVDHRIIIPFPPRQAPHVGWPAGYDQSDQP
jgi:hypothetical protein